MFMQGQQPQFFNSCVTTFFLRFLDSSMFCNFAKISCSKFLKKTCIFSDITLTSDEASILTSVTQLGFPIGGKVKAQFIFLELAHFLCLLAKDI